jgi:hypothetical protein
MILGSFAQAMSVEQSAQFKQRIDRNSRFRFISESITDPRNQHPIGYRYLRTSGKSNNQNYRVNSPQIANYFNFYAIERMTPIANLGWVQFMSSMRRPCGTVSPLTCSKPARIYGPSRFC